MSAKRLVGAALLFWTAPRVAGAEEVSWLSYSPPPECPSAQYIHERLVEWLGPDFSTEALRVQAQLAWENPKWRVNVLMDVGEAHGERTVAVSSCTEAADFVALSIALAVDAEFLPPESEATEAPSKNPKTESSNEGSATSELVSSATPSAPAAGETNELLSASPPEAPLRHNPLRWFVSAQLIGESGVLPRFALGAGLNLGLELSRLRVFSEAFVLPPVSVSTGGTVNEFWLAGGGVGTCGVFRGAHFSAGPCFSAQWGSLTGSNTQSSGGGLFAAILPGLFVTAGSSRVRGMFRGDVIVPYASPRFELSGGTIVHDPGPGVRFELGAEFFVMD